MTNHAQQGSEFTRRSVLRSGLLTGIGAAGLVGASAPLARAARASTIVPESTAKPDATAPQQFNWVYCKVCAGMFYCGSNHEGRGRCPANSDNATHADTSSYESYDYGFYYNGAGSGFQANWFWCSNCAGMFYGKNGNRYAGVCPRAEGTTTHDGSTSYNYLIYNGGPQGGYQSNWLWCSNCDGLFFGGSGDNFNYFQGICPINGGDVNGSYVYHNGGTILSDIYYVQWNGTQIAL